MDKLPPEGCRRAVEELAGSIQLKEEEKSLDCIAEDEEDDENGFKISGSIEMDNSRMDIDQLLNYAFDKNELTDRSSVMISSSKAGARKEMTLESFEIISIIGKGTFG